MSELSSANKVFANNSLKIVENASSSFSVRNCPYALGSCLNKSKKVSL